MNQESDHAEVATIRSQLGELTERVVTVALAYEDTADSAIASDLFIVERHLISARRAIERAVRALA